MTADTTEKPGHEQDAPDAPAKESRLKRAAWFVGLYVASLAFFTGLAYLLRFILGLG